MVLCQRDAFRGQEGKRLKDIVESLEWSGSIAYGLWSFMLAQP